MICRTFSHSPVFRVGGDEFVVILENEDYENRVTLIESLNRQTEERRGEIGSTVAVGIADFESGSDESFLKVFTRAGQAMYLVKNEMKKQSSRS